MANILEIPVRVLSIIYENAKEVSLPVLLLAAVTTIALSIFFVRAKPPLTSLSLSLALELLS
jgi:hypothetical protein